MKKKLIVSLFALAAVASAQLFAESFAVKSPDGKLEAIVRDGSALTLEIKADGKTLFEPFQIGMKTDKGDFGFGSKAKGSTLSSVDETIKTIYGLRSEVADKYNLLEVDFDGFRLFVRAYDEAVAYRFSYAKNGEITVFDETLNLPLKADDKVITHAVNGVQNSFERLFIRETVADLSKHHSHSLPFLALKNGYTVALVESDVLDYPGLRIAAGAKAWFAKAPKTFFQMKNYMRGVSETYDYIAKTKGARDFPWRAFIVARKDADLAVNDTVYKLASPSRLSDTSWISFGTCAWEWWSDCTLEGVGFVGGVNNETYRYFIDFASENNIPFVLIDAGWLTGVDVGKMDKDIDEAMISGKAVIDVPGLIEYAHSKDVKIILWCVGQSMDKYGEKAFDILAGWKADGVKIDFIDRDDQQAQGFYERMAKIAADRKMLIDFHGCAKPAGLQRTYPNVVNFEAVLGGEVNKWSDAITPSHNIDLVFTRMLQGPMDYTPGAMRNKTRSAFQRSYSFPQAQGTRSHMVSMYILFYAPLQMLCDSPTEYKKDPDILHFIANAPTTWDDSKALDGKIGEYVVVARRKGDSWYVGGMNNWTARDIEIDLSKILPSDTDFKAEIIRDNANSNKVATDYTREVVELTSESKLNIRMAKGGGFAIKITPNKIPVIDDIIKFFTED